MNKDKFFTMTPEERVKEINALLQKYDLKFRCQRAKVSIQKLNSMNSKLL